MSRANAKRLAVAADAVERRNRAERLARAPELVAVLTALLAWRTARAQLALTPIRDKAFIARKDAQIRTDIELASATDRLLAAVDAGVGGPPAGAAG